MKKGSSGTLCLAFEFAFLFTLFTAQPARATPDGAAALAIVQKNNCLGCHAVKTQVVGPAYQAVAKKYKNDPSAPEKLFAKVRNGGAGVWGEIPMPPNPTISDADLHTVIDWIRGGAK
ncbi:c-type cytochrome [Caballeronia sp. DA-9]|uniref:c-type cytochrome n=1 Tax=Caballeronia sp. DA-9 TaxID=3436237 RepID=UPI003F666445